MADPVRYATLGPVELWLGDAAATLATLSAGSVDCVVTSPPYWGLRDYRTGRWTGGQPTCAHTGGDRPVCARCGAVWTDLQYGLEPTLDAYLDHLGAVFEQVHRVLAPAGTCWVNMGDGYVSAAGGAPASGPPHRGRRTPRPRAQDLLAAKNLIGVPWRLGFQLQRAGWILRNAVVWAKPNPMPSPARDRLTASYELLFLLVKQHHYYFNLDPIRIPHTATTSDRTTDAAATRPGRPGTSKHDGAGVAAGAARGNLRPVGHAHTAANPAGRNPGDVWTIATRPYRGSHTAAFPVDLPMRAIAAGSPPGGVVCDPFSGAGTTGLAAITLGRRYLGIDINPTFHDQALARLQPHLHMSGADPADDR